MTLREDVVEALAQAQQESDPWAAQQAMFRLVIDHAPTPEELNEAWWRSLHRRLDGAD